jgi:hypothetical protein
MRAWGKSRRSLAGAGWIALVVVAIVGCGGGDPEPVVTGAGSAPASGPSGVETPGGAGSVTTVTVGATVRGQVTTVTLTPNALAGLRSFLASVDRTDGQLARTAKMINADFTPSGATFRPATITTIKAIDLAGLARAVPAGMPPELTRRALLVFSELSSRAAAFHGVLRAVEDGNTVRADEMAVLRDCLANGAKAQARFGADLAALRVLAGATAPFAATAPSSRAVGEIAVRTQYIQGWNLCCDGCGGYITDKLAPVVWKAEDLPNGEHIDGKIDGVGFEATYRAGRGWEAVIHAG